MPPSREDDLDWLYGRPTRPAEPEPTRVLSRPSDLDDAPGPEPHPVGEPAPRPAEPAAHRHPGPPPPWTRAVAPPTAPPTAPPGRGPGGRRGSGGGRGPRRRGHPVRRTLRILAGLVVLLVVWLVAVPVHAYSGIGRVDDSPAGDRPTQQPGRTFLLVGSDSREGLTEAQRTKLGTGSTEGRRTDTIMLLSVPPSGPPALVSLPRDSYLAVPGHGQDKINAAYAYGGAPLLEQTVEQATALRVDGYLEIGFGGFVGVIDSLGGIEMCLKKAIKDADSHLDLPKGCQTLDGTNALGYVRMRKADPLGDLGRVQRQRQMLAAVAKEAASPATVLNPVRYWRVTHAATAAVGVGQDTSVVELVSLGLALRSVAAGDGVTLTVPVSDPGASTPVGSAVLWDDEQAQALFAALASGRTDDLGRYAG